jgi:hypothetical protein
MTQKGHDKKKKREHKNRKHQHTLGRSTMDGYTFPAARSTLERLLPGS